MTTELEKENTDSLSAAYKGTMHPPYGAKTAGDLYSGCSAKQQECTNGAAIEAYHRGGDE